MRYLVNYLNLIYPPISNQEADWLSKDEDVRRIVKSSNLYMIGQRKQVFFEDIEFHPILNGAISFNLRMGQLRSPKIYYSIYNELTHFNNESDEIQLELGPKLIRFTLNNEDNVISWFTPDIFLYLLSRNRIKVVIGEEFDFKRFSEFELHYVGISKEGDSFSRLFDQGHKGRLKILSNEYTKELEARLTDELFIFFFDIEHFNINIFNDFEQFETDFNYYSDKIKIISDAEKAFVKLLDTKYNQVKFNNYPKSSDGLYDDSLIRYGFSIQEDISFYTSSIQFNGSYNIFTLEPNADLIIVEGDEANLIKLT
ncbi:hypothetical protein CWR48_18225 [Oceanobacillus arenosus]|uniref:Uncharacterized protein n=1 Tax=Oceanobacillus arenosus TaxID=1229153 RepID=A0A3D8PJ54_9BACI|nr:hypothetical protein [Oceanobacillus arenosus]RDW16123.1 hypothetical protein CWR48_18225 [Oceanobacillus arenosus]